MTVHSLVSKSFYKYKYVSDAKIKTKIINMTDMILPTVITISQKWILIATVFLCTSIFLTHF